ncbi:MULTISPECIES: protein translocase subunit SecDF [unclassified Sinorhizobium]|uniref:protein translocase subunit SecDF n=1 Tax=unclassified Sinorhizobium TaxID=2613772 RepID=UPI003523FA7C
MLHFSRWKTFLIWFAVLLGAVAAAPNFLSDRQLASLPEWLAHRSLDLGLDLQGGSRIMLKIERADVVKSRLEATVGDVRTRLRDAHIPYAGLAGVGQTVEVRISDPNQVQAAIDALTPLTAPVRTGASGRPVQPATLLQADQGRLILEITDEGINSSLSSAIAQSVDVVRRRIAELGSEDPVIESRGADRIIVQMTGSIDLERLKNLLIQPGDFSFRLFDRSMAPQQALGRPPANSQILYSMDDPPIAYLVQRQPLFSNRDIADARADFDPQNNEGVVRVRLNAEAANHIAQSTQTNLGKSIAVVLDDQVVSTSVLRAPILDGNSEVAGDFSAQGAQDLAILLRSGPLPAALTTVEERTVRPGLGNETVRSGIIACLAAAGFVAASMVLFYGLLGIVATIALVINIIMVLAIMSALGITLTLPGIAAIVLIIGMAIDANVLIYERVREEEKKTHLLVAALRKGFSRAASTVADANLTVLIVAAVLLYASSGAVQGFAAALVIGVFTTFFTACLVTRSIIDICISRRRPRALLAGVRSGIFDGASIRFMAIRRYTFSILAALSVAIMLAFAAVGMHLGIDFTGGSIIEVRAKQGVADLQDIQSRLADLNLGEIRVDSIGNRSSAIIRVQSQGGGENAEQSAVTLIRGELDQDYEFRRVEVVGPAVSGELTLTATLGVLASLAAILVYIWFRFEWQFAVGAIIATLHDVILMLGLFVLTGMEFNLISIAALLTIAGYSLNDTVVVYDRMRENLRRYPRMPLPILIDASINQTLSRTVLTSVMTMLALLALYLFGGEVIRSFAFTMLFGVAVATFSSIYIAAPLLILFKLRPDASDEEGNKAATDTDIQSSKPAV